MSQPIVSVDRLSKQYRLGTSRYGYRTFREAITDGVRAPLRRLRGAAKKSRASETIWALKEVEFTVEPGEVVGIIGRNGAGKSTLLKVLSRITEPTSGRVELGGRVASLLEVGTGFHPELTGQENIYLNGAILGMTRKEIQRKFDEIVAFAEVERFVDTPVKRYSSGMYLRLAFAVASHLEPEILVVDEVLAVGDQQFQKRCMGRMREVSSSGRTVLFVSHNMAAVSSLCTRAVCLHQGQLAADGGVTEVVAAYHRSGASSGPAEYSLESSPRHGSGGGRITGFRLLDQAGRAVDRVSLGDAAHFEMTFTCSRRIRSPAFAVSFHAADGRRILRLHSSEMGDLLPGCERGGRVVCRLDELTLTPGPYFLTLALGEYGVEVMDQIDQCIEINIDAADFYGTGRLPDQQSSAFVLRGKWDSQYA